MSFAERIAEASDFDDPVNGCASISLDVFIRALDQVQMTRCLWVGRWVRSSSWDWAKESVANSDVYKLSRHSFHWSLKSSLEIRLGHICHRTQNLILAGNCREGRRHPR